MIQSDWACSPIERGNRLKILRAMTNLSQKAFSENFGIGINTLNYWESGRLSGLSEKGARKIIDLCRKMSIDCDLDWLLYGRGPGPRLINTASILPEKYQNISSELDFFCARFPDHLYMEITDEAMLPFYAPGDYVAGIRKYGDDVEFLMGNHCIVETDSGKTLCRLVVPSEKTGAAHLVSTNIQEDIYHSVITNVTIKCLAKVIFIRKKE